MDFSLYLKRIGYAGPLIPDFSTLLSLFRHHLFCIPFENLDIQLDIPISLDITSLYDKIVLRHRGGYCYEVNGLFYSLLMALGFDVRLISGRVVRGNQYGPDFDHLALIVVLNGKEWLVDAGYGEFSLIPLQIKENLMQSDGRNQFTIRKIFLSGKSYYGVFRKRKQKDSFVPEYYFDTHARTLEEFAAMNDYQQTASGGYFRKNLLCTIPTAQGRVSLINNRLIVKSDDLRRNIRISQSNLSQILKQYFNIQPGVALQDSRIACRFVFL